MNLTDDSLADFESNALEVADILRALANERRLMILCKLVEKGEATVGTLVGEVGVSQSALSQHLGVLRSAQLVSTRRESQTIYYALADGPALKIMEVLYDTFCAPAAKQRAAGTARRKGSRSC